MQISNSNNLNFQARKIALTRNVFNGVKTHIDLYELSSKDTKFLEKLRDKINIPELMPDLAKPDAKSWQDVLNFTINAALDKSIKKYLAVSNQKPCGIMALQKEGRTMNLLGISSIPIGVNQKANYAATTLFCQLFQNAKNSKPNRIVLEAVRNSGFDLVSRYKEKGFFPGETGERYISMKCPKRQIIPQFKKLQAATNYTPVRTKEVEIDSFI